MSLDIDLTVTRQKSNNHFLFLTNKWHGVSTICSSDEASLQPDGLDFQPLCLRVLVLSVSIITTYVPWGMQELNKCTLIEKSAPNITYCHYRNVNEHNVTYILKHDLY